MMRWHYRFLYAALMLSLVFWLAGCARPFSQELLDKVDRSVTFKELQSDPEKYKGAWVMLAGVIVASKSTKEGTFIEVLQKPMDSRGRPLQTDATEGRFIVRSDMFLDAAVYHRGRQLTVIAEVVGRKELPLDEITYSYPFLVIKGLHLWEPSSGPRFFFGVGVSGRM